jgi:hypothetical protein
MQIGVRKVESSTHVVVDIGAGDPLGPLDHLEIGRGWIKIHPQQQ